MSVVLQRLKRFFICMAEGKRLTRSIVGINWHNKFRADSVHGNREAFENILLMLLTVIPQMQYYCLKNREDVVKRCTIRLQKQKQVKNRKKEEKDAMLSQRAWALPCRVAWHLLFGGG